MVSALSPVTGASQCAAQQGLEMRLLELTESMWHPTGVAEVPEHWLEPGKAGQWVSGGWGRRGTGGLTGASVPGSGSRSCGPRPSPSHRFIPTRKPDPGKKWGLRHSDLLAAALWARRDSEPVPSWTAFQPTLDVPFYETVCVKFSSPNFVKPIPVRHRESHASQGAS